MPAELYLSLHGVQVRVSFAAPKELLDLRENVQQDKHLRLAGTKGIRAIGDVGNSKPKQLTVTDGQINHLANALHAVLTETVSPAEYHPAGKTMIFLSSGKKLATGQIRT
ncbi:hypothetical protein C2857_003817 [Epichloe festucae Fl1]|uniref:Uncharacterized protein n=1 Tax=Epichloe festucae (strain Fl1) TaxID=877507 RepID=A0A7S9PWW9_EPIFF|nr:hypothetical protein C2857_003817 [Epichloe festucae Fl1]